MSIANGLNLEIVVLSLIVECLPYYFSLSKVPPGCLLGEPFTQVTIFYMSLEPSLGTLMLSSLLTQLHTLFVAQLLLTPRIICLRCAQLNLQTLACFVPSIIHNHSGAAYSHNTFQKLAWPGLKPATPRWESRHFDHAANPTGLYYYSYFG